MVTPGYQRRTMLSGKKITTWGTEFCATSTYFNRLNEGGRKNEWERVRMESYFSTGIVHLERFVHDPSGLRPYFAHLGVSL